MVPGSGVTTACVSENVAVKTPDPVNVIVPSATSEYFHWARIRPSEWRF